MREGVVKPVRDVTEERGKGEGVECTADEANFRERGFRDVGDDLGNDLGW